MSESSEQPTGPIIVRPLAVSDPSVEELQSLADAISAVVGMDVVVAEPEPIDSRIAQVTLVEVVNVWLPYLQAVATGAAVTIGVTVAKDVYEAVIQKIRAEFVDWTRRRFRAHNQRPKSINIYGPDGHLLRSIKVRSASAEPEDDTGEQETFRRPPDPG